jgi:hypothetical protein
MNDPNGQIINPMRTLLGKITLQPAQGTDPPEYDCLFIGAGRVKMADGRPSKWLIPAAALRDAVPLFSGASSYIDHPVMFGFGWHQSPSLRDLVGTCLDPEWSEEEQGITGRIRLFNGTDAGQLLQALYDQVLADREQGKPTPEIGLSAVIWHNSHLDEETGLRITDEITMVDSVDHVYSAGARGYVRSALARAGWELDSSRSFFIPSHTGASQTPERVQAPKPKEVTPMAPKNQQEGQQETLAPTPPVVVTEPAPPADPPVTIAQHSEGNRGDQPPDLQIASILSAINQRLDTIETQQASLAEVGTVEDMGTPPRGVVYGMTTGLDQIALAAEALLSGTRPEGNVRPLSGIRELYTLLSGDYEMTGVFNGERVYLANVTTATMAQIVANVLNKRVVIAFQQYPQWWAPIVSVEDFATLQDVRWITLGGVGELPTVNEGAAYSELTWDDLAQRDAFIKKGGYLGLTLEAIDKDDTRRIQLAPRALAQAAWLTLSKSVSGIFTDNSGVGPNIYYDDSNQRALFHASNGNLGTTALSVTSWAATRIAMRKQTEHNSGERLGALTVPKFCLVPPDLEFTAIEVLASENKPGGSNNDVNVEARGNTHDARLAAARERVIVVDLWTDANDWAAVADPQLYPSIGIGFRFGRTPEIFSVADPRAGLMFSNDVMPVKVRFLYAVGPVDWRGMYKHNVA